MASTDVSLCSNALLMLGAGTIADFSEQNTEAILAANLFPQVRDAVLRSHTWNCAVKRVILAPEVTVPDFDYTAQFAVPDDWMRTIQVGDRGAEIDFRQEGRKFLANSSTFKLRYVYRNEAVASWDPMLCHAVSLLLKAAFAYPITKSSSLATESLTDATNYLKLVRAVDGQDEPPETLGQFMLLSARGGDPSSWSWRG